MEAERKALENKVDLQNDGTRVRLISKENFIQDVRETLLAWGVTKVRWLAHTNLNTNHPMISEMGLRALCCFDDGGWRFCNFRKYAGNFRVAFADAAAVSYAPHGLIAQHEFRLHSALGKKEELAAQLREVEQDAIDIRAEVSRAWAILNADNAPRTHDNTPFFGTCHNYDPAEDDGDEVDNTGEDGE